MLVFKDITARHSGKYTCFARNSAAKVNYTAEMLVRGICTIEYLFLCFLLFFFLLSVWYLWLEAIYFHAFKRNFLHVFLADIVCLADRSDVQLTFSWALFIVRK